MKNTRREELIKKIQEGAKTNPEFGKMLIEKALKARNKNKSSDK